jgi:hypothetical protein
VLKRLRVSLGELKNEVRPSTTRSRRRVAGSESVRS